MTETLGIDHLYLSVRALEVSERFYDLLLVDVLGFRKSRFALGGDPHIQYYNRQLGLVIRPAHAGAATHDPGSPGLHHLCLRVDAEGDVDRVAGALRARGVDTSPPRYYPDYAADYYATFLADPDGVRLEITNFRAERRARMYRWDDPAATPVRALNVSLAEALAQGPPPPGNLAVPIFAQGSLLVELYTPRGIDPQEPHDRDEVYVVARGTGAFFDGTARRPVEAGSFLFVGAGQAHRFEDTSADFAVWVMFYGPRGGESGG